jgi:hypothetical protein
VSRDAAILGGCLLLALAAIVYALRCLSERLLVSAVIYTVIAVALFALGAREAVEAL